MPESLILFYWPAALPFGFSSHNLIRSATLAACCHLHCILSEYVLIVYTCIEYCSQNLSSEYICAITDLVQCLGLFSSFIGEAIATDLGLCTYVFKYICKTIK